MRQYFLLFVTVAGSTVHATGQNIQTFTQFYINPSLLNPSFTGTDGRPSVFASYRKQWYGISGSPTLANLNIQAPVGKRVNLGLNLNSDKRGLLNTSSAMITGGYTLPLSTKQSIRFGLSLGVASNLVDVNSLSFAQSGDPVTASLAGSNMQMLGNAGLTFNSTTFHVGASIPNIFQPAYFSQDAFSLSKVKPFENVIIHTSNRFYFSRDKNVFEPYLIYRLNKSIPSQWEAAAIFHLQNLLWVGASYKQDFGLSGLAGFNISKELGVGFSYTIQNAGANQVNRPSFEMHLAMHFGNIRKGVPVYSFTDTEKEKPPSKKSQQEMLAQKKKSEQELVKKQKELDDKKKEAALAKNAPVQPVKEQPLPQKAVTPQKMIANPDSSKAKKPVVATRPQPQDSARRSPRALFNRIQIPVAKTQEAINDSIRNERHEIVVQGEHQDELPVGNYVVAGVFAIEEHAQKFTQELLQNGHKARNGYLTAKARWYVYVFRSEDLEKTRKARDDYRQLQLFKSAWLLTVRLQ